MAGVLFVVCVPSSCYEKKLRKTDKTPEKSVAFNFNLNQSISADDLSKHKANDVAMNEEARALLEATPTPTPTSPTRLQFIDEEGGKATPVAVSETPTLLDLGEQERCMQTYLEKTLKRVKIENAVWNTVKGDNYFQVSFTVGSELCEEVLSLLDEWGIGSTLNSSVSVLPCSVFYDGLAHADSDFDVSATALTASDAKAKAASASASAWDKFVASVGARLTVAQVVERVKADARLTFDFLVLLLMAGVVATLGLIENSTVVLVASMLISPLMGPIMAGTFGFVIEDRRLRKMGVRNELAGLSICLVVGFAIGLVVGVVDDFSGAGQLPTEEMLSRGRVRSLWVGALIALPSGAAVAIALLGDKTGSLVGVAISASILPPAVNAGLLWALACIRLIWEKAGDPEGVASPSFVYSEDLSCELAILGAVSLCLTLVNILCIFLMGIIVLKIKEVAPRTSGKQSQFWRHDIKIARDYNKTVNKEEGKLLQKQLADELAGFADVAPHISPERILDMSSRLLPRHQLTWSPSARGADSRMSLQQLEDLYLDLTTAPGHRAPAVRRANSLMPPESLGANVGWYRSSHHGGHMSPELSRTLSAIRETSASDAPKRRMTYAAHDPPTTRHSQRRRFVVSPVDEDVKLDMTDQR